MAFDEGCVVQLKSDTKCEGKITGVMYDPVYQVTWSDKPNDRPCYMRNELVSMTPVTFNRKAKIGTILLTVLLLIIIIVGVHSHAENHHKHPNQHPRRHRH